MQDAAQRSAEILAKHKLVDVRGAADSVTLTHYQFAGREGRPRTVREQAFQVSACERLMARMGLSATDCPAGLFAVRTLPDNGVVYREADLLVSAQWVDEKGEGESRLDVVCLGARHSVSATVSHSGERVFFELPFPLVRVPYNETVATVDGTPLDASKEEEWREKYAVRLDDGNLWYRCAWTSAKSKRPAANAKVSPLRRARVELEARHAAEKDAAAQKM